MSNEARCFQPAGVDPSVRSVSEFPAACSLEVISYNADRTRIRPADDRDGADGWHTVLGYAAERRA